MTTMARDGSVSAPPRLFEYWYFFSIFYAVLGSALGVALGSAGVLSMGLLALLCALQNGARTLPLIEPIVFPLGFGLSYLIIEVLVLHEPITGELVRPIVPWMVGVFVIQCLAMRRGFFHRATIAIFLVGACTLPYLAYHGSTTRLGLQKDVSIANQNDLSAWFGFCCLYFAIVALETRRQWIRAAAALISVGCLYVVAITVSRAPLIAIALGLVVACRRLLKRGFIPFLSLALLAWLAYGFGVFDKTLSLYADRGMEETGRLLIWPAAFNRYLTHPWLGFGASDSATPLPEHNVWVTPHNQFLMVALSSGIIPLTLFISYWVKAARDTWQLNVRSHEDAAFLTPMFVYVLLIGLELNQPYMNPWAMITLGTLAAEAFRLKAIRFAPRARSQHDVQRQRATIVPVGTKA